MKQIVVYVHGKGGSAEEAEHYSALFPDSEVLGFDYRAQTPWEAREEVPRFFAAQRARCGRLTLIANSIGAYFSLLHSVRGAGRADRHADHYGVCGEERRSPDRYAGRRALVPHG